MDGYKSSSATRHRRWTFLCWGIAITALLATALPAGAGSLEKAKRMHDRLTGVPPSASVLASMQTLLATDPIAAANLAMDNPAFYNAKLKNWITPWTNRDGNKFAPLNDFTATVIGIIRDRVDYRQVLYGDILYVPNATYGTYSTVNNDAYAAAEAVNANLGDTSVLVATTQSSKIPALAVAPNPTAGIMTTRAAARAFFVDGTNRAMFRFTLKNMLCHDMETVQDTTRPTDRIRRDVFRSPGGDSRIFMNTCVGCHSGMDPMAQAFAFYDFQYDKTAADADAARDVGQLVYTAGAVQAKYDINHDHFADGFITPDDQWHNYWRDGPDTAIFGWGGGAGSGTGAKTMGQELANSEAFAVCSVKKVFQTVCLRDPSSNDQSTFTAMLNNFKSGYDLKHTFAEAADYCSGN